MIRIGFWGLVSLEDWDFIYLFKVGSYICSFILKIPLPDSNIMTASDFPRYFSTKIYLLDVLPLITTFYPHHFQAFRGYCWISKIYTMMSELLG